MTDLSSKITYLHMLPKTGWMCVRLITAPDFAVVWFIAGMHVAVFFPITRVGKPTITTLKLTFERFLSCNKGIKRS